MYIHHKSSMFEKGNNHIAFLGQIFTWYVCTYDEPL